MIRIALISLALAVAVPAGHAFAASDRQVIDMDGGPGQRFVIVRDGGSGDDAWWSQGRDVLDYTEADGAHVRVYADRPVSRAEAESRLAEADRDTAQARARGLRAAVEGKSAARLRKGSKLAQTG